MAIATEKRANGTASTATGSRPGAAPEIAPVPFDHEELVVRRGRRSGLPCIVAVHSTALGPALGGLRIWHYPSTVDAARDALRLAAGMSLKAAAAGLDLGGGKGVICAPAEGLGGRRRTAALLDFGDLVESLEGRYITAEDVGVSPSDLVAISERTAHLTGLPPERGGSGDPSPVTAIGVEAAIRACATVRFGDRDLNGLRVAVVGLGHVGSELARRLEIAGCDLVVSDIDTRKRALAAWLGAEWVRSEEGMLADCDVLAPCALGGAVNAENAARLRCRVVCGSANNQLADDSLAPALARRGILYAPDFIANAGGLVNVYREIKGYSAEHATAMALAIERTLLRVFGLAERDSTTPLDAARALARERLDRALRD